MSTGHDHRRSLPESLRRMQSALTGATGWITTALSGGDGDRNGDGDEDVAAGGRAADPRDDGDRGPGRSARGEPREIVTPEERVVRLVTENGGQMKQGDVVSAVEWSESTVSRKLSKLESEGTITRYQIGREKLVFLPGAEPDSLGSPWREIAADVPGKA